jgi:pimeloyl-ACP methyl ester carboxylesterase
MRFCSSSSPTTPPPPRALSPPPRGVGVGGSRARPLRRDYGGNGSSSSSSSSGFPKGRKAVVTRAAKNDSGGAEDDDDDKSASSSSSTFNLFSRRKSVVEDPGENATTTTTTSSSASFPLLVTLFKGHGNKEETTRNDNDNGARESKKVVSSSLFPINERSKHRRGEEAQEVEKNAKMERGKQKTSLVSRLLTSIGGKKEDQEREQREETKREEKKSAAGAVAGTANGMSIDEVPVVGSIARAIKSRRVDRIRVPVVGTFSELYRHAEIATMNDWKEENVKEWFKKRGEEARVLEVPSIDQRVILAVNDREKRITIGLRGTKTLVNAAQNLRLTTSAPTFRNNNISLGGSSIDGTQQQRRFPTIKFPTITDARRKELFEEFPDFNVKMHRGYRTIAMVVKREVNQYLKDGYEVDLQGHSLGGACALALALLYHHEGKTKVRRVVTFGSPKLGPKDTQDAAEKAGLKILRVVQKDDIFPFLPMSRPGVTQPYVHCGEGIYLDSDQPGKFAELPRWYGGSGILWRQKAIVTEAYKSSLKKRNETLLSADYDPLQPEKINVPGIGPRNEKIAKWVKRIRRQRFLKARQTLFSFANEDYALAAALGREEIKDLSDASSGSFDEEDSTLMKAGLEPSKMDIVDLSNRERRLESKMTVGPTIFERLRDLQKFDQKERVRRLECHRMVRYRDEVKSLMDVGPQQVNLNDMFDDLYTNFRERKNTAGNTNNNSNNIASNGGGNGVKAAR